MDAALFNLSGDYRFVWQMSSLLDTPSVLKGCPKVGIPKNEPAIGTDKAIKIKTTVFLRIMQGLLAATLRILCCIPCKPEVR